MGQGRPTLLRAWPKWGDRPQQEGLRPPSAAAVPRGPTAPTPAPSDPRSPRKRSQMKFKRFTRPSPWAFPMPTAQVNPSPYQGTLWHPPSASISSTDRKPPKASHVPLTSSPAPPGQRLRWWMACPPWCSSRMSSFRRISWLKRYVRLAYPPSRLRPCRCLGLPWSPTLRGNRSPSLPLPPQGDRMGRGPSPP